MHGMAGVLRTFGSGIRREIGVAALADVLAGILERNGNFLAAG